MSVRHAIGGWALFLVVVLGRRAEQPTQQGDEARLESMRGEIEAMVGAPAASMACART